MANMQYRATGLPDLYEGVIVRNKEHVPIQPVFRIFPNLDESCTKDLFSPHPTKPGLWLYRGRADDMFVSATGEMCNPVPFEQVFSRHPQVTAVLVVGTGRYQKALLIEPAEHQESREALLDSIWSTIKSCNEEYPSIDRISRDHVLLTELGRH